MPKKVSFNKRDAIVNESISPESNDGFNHHHRSRHRSRVFSFQGRFLTTRTFQYIRLMIFPKVLLLIIPCCSLMCITQSLSAALAIDLERFVRAVSAPMPRYTKCPFIKLVMVYVAFLNMLIFALANIQLYLF